MAENRRAQGQGFYYFTRAQLVILAVAFAVTFVVIFFLGILVGKGIEERKLLKREEPIVKIPIQPSAQGSGPSKGALGEQEMTFYDTLTRGPGGKMRTEGQAQGVQLKKKKTATPAKKKPPVAAKATMPPRKGKDKKSVETSRKEPVWSVQVNAFIHQKEANNLAQRMKTTGHDAFIVSTRVKGRTWYRVRVGRFETRGEAEKLLRTLQTKGRYTKAIIARDG
jgi:cell division septation protein DedD